MAPPARPLVLLCLCLAAVSLRAATAQDLFAVRCRVTRRNVLINNVNGTAYCCSFRNNQAVALINYQLGCSGVDPLSLNPGDITPNCIVDTTVEPGKTKEFCFVNRAESVPMFTAPGPARPSPAITVTEADANLNVVCNPNPKFGILGRILIATWSCNVTNLLSNPLTAIGFDCGGVPLIFTNNLNADCSYPFNLNPAGTSGATGRFTFTTLTNDMTIAESVSSVVV